jgi:hypothetical protein
LSRPKGRKVCIWSAFVGKITRNGGKITRNGGKMYEKKELPA